LPKDKKYAAFKCKQRIFVVSSKKSDYRSENGEKFYRISPRDLILDKYIYLEEILEGNADFLF